MAAASPLRKYWERLHSSAVQQSPDLRKDFFSDFFSDSTINKHSSFWMEIALRGVADSWSPVRRLSARAVARSLREQRTSQILVEQLKCVLTSPWYKLEGHLILIAELQLSTETLYSQNDLLSLALRFILPCVTHAQLPVREAAVSAAISLISVESFQLFLRSFISQKIEQEILSSSAAPNVLEGALSLALAAKSEACIKPNILVELLGNDSSSVRQYVAAVLAKDSVCALVRRLIDQQQQPSNKWEASETLLMALCANLQDTLERSSAFNRGMIDNEDFDPPQTDAFLRLVADLCHSPQFEIQRMAKQVSPLYVQFLARCVRVKIDAVSWPEESLALLAWLIVVNRYATETVKIPRLLLESRQPTCRLILYTYFPLSSRPSNRELVDDWQNVFNQNGLADDERFLSDFCSKFDELDLLLPAIISALQRAKCSHTQCHLLEALKVACSQKGASHKLFQFAWDVDREPPTNKDGGDAVPRGIHWLRHALPSAPISSVAKGLEDENSFGTIRECVRKVALRRDIDPCVVVRCWDIAAQIFHRGALSYDALVKHVTERLHVLFPQWRVASPLPPSPSKGSFDDSSDDEAVAGFSLQSELWLLKKWFSRTVPDYATRSSQLNVQDVFDKIVEEQ